MSIKRKTVKLDLSKRIIKYRPPSPSFKRNMQRTADGIFNYCCELWRGDGSNLDSSVQGVLSNGIAKLLHVAFDCQACALGLQGEAFSGFIDSSVAEWFRSRGFAEWYCQGAGCLFNNSRPRIMEDRVIGTPKRRGRNVVYKVQRKKKV